MINFKMILLMFFFNKRDQIVKNDIFLHYFYKIQINIYILDFFINVL